MSHEYILGYKFTTDELDDCIRTIYSWLSSEEEAKYFVAANPHSIIMASKDYIFSEAIKYADFVVPDGIGVVLASKILGGQIRQRITGSDIFYTLTKLLNEKTGYKYCFLGTTESNLLIIKKKMENDYPNIQIVGTYSPPFKDQFSEEENNEMINKINNVKPDVLWIGLTAPKQEKWVFENKDKLDVKFIAPVGALFDFFSGKIKRSHPWFRSHGLEWLPRLVQEPHRLWRRNFVSNPMFLYRVIRSFLNHFINKRLI